MSETLKPGIGGTAVYGPPAAQADLAARRSAYWQQPIQKIGKRERVLHWVMAINGIIAMITGMGWYWKSANFILAIFGGGEVARLIHVFTGTVFSLVALVLICGIWWRQILVLRKYDFVWMKTMGGYLERQKDDEPHEHAPAGMFNAGQKMLGMTYVALALGLLVSGVIIWWPELFPTWLTRIGLALHALCFIGFGAGLIAHVYLSTAANPGTFGAITHGKVTRLYAHSHHPEWFKELEHAESTDEAPKH